MLGLLTLALLVLGAVFALAQTEFGRRQIAAVIERQLSGPEARAEVRGLEGLVPVDVRLERLALADPEGVWLEVRDARLAWSPGALLRGRLHVDELSAARVDVHRLPADTAPAPDEPDDDEPFRLPELPETLPPVAVDRLAIERIGLGEPVLGQAAAFTLEGRVAAAADGSSALASLDLRRVDEATGRAELDAVLALGRAPELTLTLEAEETGGLLADVTGRPEAGAFRLNLRGSGPVERWTGHLVAEAEGLARLDTDVALSLDAEPSVALAGRLTPRGTLVPPDLAPLLGESLGLAVTVTQTAEQRLAIDGLRLTTDVAQLEGRARIDLEAQRVAANATARIDDLAPLGDVAQASLAGSLALEVDAEGALTQPAVGIELRVTDLAADPVAAARVTAALRLDPLAPEARRFSGLRVTGGGAVEGLALTGGPALPEDGLRWELAATVPAGDGPIAVDRLAVTSGDLLDLVATATVDPAGPAGGARVRLVAGDLAPLAALADQAIAGAAELTADIAVEDDGRLIRATLGGRLSGLDGLPPGAAQLLGSEVTLAAEADVRPAGRATVTGIEVDGAAARLRGDVALELVDGRSIDGELALALPALGALEPVVGRPLRGEAVIAANLAGTLAAPEVRLDVTGGDIAFAGQGVDALTARVTALGLPDLPRGDLSLTLEREGQRLTAAGAYRLEGQTLALPGLRLSAPATTLGGDLAVRLDGPLVEGRLSGTSRELAALGALLGGEPGIAGRLSLTADLAAVDGRQDVALTANAADLTGGFGRIAALDLRARVRDALSGRPGIDATAGLTRFRSGDAFVRAASLRAAGDPTALDLTASAAGEQAVPFDLGAAARIALAGDTTTVRLNRLDGRVAWRPVALQRPATLTLTGDGAAVLRDLELRIATGRLRADGSYGPDEVRLRASLLDLPLEAAAPLGAPRLTGTATAELDVAGPLSAPGGTLTATATGVRLADPAFEAVPAATVRLDAALEGRRLDAGLRAERLTDRPITARLSAPLILSLEPFAFEVPEDGAINGGLNLEAQLARLEGYIGLGGQEVAGLLRAALTLGGTVGNPSVAGDVTVTDGSYANGTTGTVLRDITLRATGSERRIVVRELTATDGGRGRVGGDGALVLDAARAFPFEVQVRVDRAALVRRDFAQATLTGEIDLTGDLREAVVAGALTVNQAEVGLPGNGVGGGPDVAALDVVEIGPGGAPAAPPPAAEEAEPPLVVALNVAIDIPGRAFVRGRGLDSEWQGRLVIQGTADDPAIVGTLSIRRGELSFLDRTFTLREGQIEFTGASPPVPTVDLTAVAEAGGFTAVVRVTGPASNPQVELTSEPPLPQDEILSRLLFNRPAGGISAAQAVQLAAAVNQLRGGGPGLLGGLRRALGVDVLDIGGDAETGPTVRAGRYLSDDVFVEVERGAQEGTGRATVEVEILPSVTLEAEVTEDARTGVGVQWRYDY
ncbi:MAG TPA: translocation/assembly module TamB domain-containing protein [Geminicoccaceae bacterium]|nr:translocation/assembly module TamB domain-containing protein [Geminicoccaceae bacterium]